MQPEESQVCWKQLRMGGNFANTIDVGGPASGISAPAAGGLKHPIAWWHLIATTWTLASWTYLAVFVVPWDLDGWTGTLVFGLSTLGLLVFLVLMVMLLVNYIAERRGQMTRGEAWAIFGWSSLLWGPIAFVFLLWLGSVLGLR